MILKVGILETFEVNFKCWHHHVLGDNGVCAIFNSRFHTKRRTNRLDGQNRLNGLVD